MLILVKAYGREVRAKMRTILTRRMSIIIIAGILFIAAIYFAITAINHTGKTAISLSAFPNDMTIKIDDKTVTPGTLYFAPGAYRLEAEKKGYDSYTRTIVLKNNKQTIAVILTPNSDEAFEYGRKNEAAYRKVQAQGEVAAAESGQLFSKLNPITKDLPYKTFFYSVGYRMDQADPSGNSIIIEIDAPEGYRQSAIYRIRQLGYDPTDFTINFRDYENPFPL